MFRTAGLSGAAMLLAGYGVLLSLGGCPTNTNNANSNNSDNNSNGNANSNGSSRSKVTVTVHASSGTESSLRAKVWIGGRGVTRSEAADANALRAAGFADSDVDNTNAVGDLSREFQLDPGSVLTVIAIESEGADSGPLSLPDAPAPLDSLVEFVDFSGAAVATVEPGVGTFAANAGNGDIFVNYRRMPQIVLKLWGATGVTFDFDLPPVLAIPGRNNPNDRSFGASGYTAAPDAGVYRILQFKSGSAVSITAVPNGEFLRWEGACGGSGQECTLFFGGPSGVQDQTTTLVTGYLKCEFGGPSQYSGYTKGAQQDPRCVIVKP